MLKLYTDITLLNEKNRSQVFPLLFDLYYLKNNYLNQFYSLAEKPEIADIIILPLDYVPQVVVMKVPSAPLQSPQEE